jgi:hypothetical protein
MYVPCDYGGPTVQKVVYLHAQPEPIAHYLRLGTLHRHAPHLRGPMPGAGQRMQPYLRETTRRSNHLAHCCPRGLDDTIKNPKAHYLRQRARQFERISHIPEARRTQDFLHHDLANTARTARQAAKLKVSDVALAEMLERTSERLNRMQPVLEDLYQTVGTTPRSASPRRRTGRTEVSASKNR